MGNRVSIQFKQIHSDGGEWSSPVLFSHWDGMDLVKKAEVYVKSLKKRAKNNCLGPLDRMEPRTVMVDFIRHLTKDMKEVESNYYLGCNENEGDNSDNGHHVIELPPQKRR